MNGYIVAYYLQCPVTSLTDRCDDMIELDY